MCPVYTYLTLSNIFMDGFELKMEMYGRNLKAAYDVPVIFVFWQYCTVL